MNEVVIVSTGAANTASVRAWLARAGVESRVSTAASDINGAAALVLPGVGAFGAAMERLHMMRLVEPLRARVRDNRPTLCICLGMQLLFEGSEETSGVAGLGVIEGVVRRLPASVRTPQMGWNRVESPGRSRYAYFAHSYGVTSAPAGWDASYTTVGTRGAGPIRVAASLSRGAVVACQFHPELSSDYGAEVLSRWLARVPETLPC